MTRIPSFLRAIATSILLTATVPAQANAPAILEYSVRMPAEAAYQKLHDALEDKGYFVIFEPNMGRTLASMAGRLGKDYNRNQLSAMRSLVFCNPVLTNRIANADPALLALCPLSASLTHKDGLTHIYFARPGLLAAGSPGEALAREIENEIDQIIQGTIRVQ